MKEFFHGWRRKAGVVTLVIACAEVAIWGRGNFTGESIGLVVGNKMYFVSATDLGFECQPAFDPPPTDGLPIWWNQSHIAVHRGFDLPGFQLVESKPVWAVPHWSTLLPLTLLAAYLILWKPRNRA